MEGVKSQPPDIQKGHFFGESLLFCSASLREIDFDVSRFTPHVSRVEAAFPQHFIISFFCNFFHFRANRVFPIGFVHPADLLMGQKGKWCILLSNHHKGTHFFQLGFTNAFDVQQVIDAAKGARFDDAFGCGGPHTRNLFQFLGAG